MTRHETFIKDVEETQTCTFDIPLIADETGEICKKVGGIILPYTIEDKYYILHSSFRSLNICIVFINLIYACIHSFNFCLSYAAAVNSLVLALLVSFTLYRLLLDLVYMCT